MKFALIITLAFAAQTSVAQLGAGKLDSADYSTFRQDFGKKIIKNLNGISLGSKNIKTVLFYRFKTSIKKEFVFESLNANEGYSEIDEQVKKSFSSVIDSLTAKGELLGIVSTEYVYIPLIVQYNITGDKNFKHDIPVAPFEYIFGWDAYDQKTQPTVVYKMLSPLYYYFPMTSISVR